MPATKPRAYQVYDIDWKQAVRALSDSNINLASPGALVIDTVVLDPYDRVLLTAQTNATENGIYQVNAAQTLLVPAPDWININSGLSSAVNSGLTVSVTDGAEYAQTTWTLTTPNPVIIGTTTINFARTPDQISNVAIDGTTIELANNASETSISIKPSGTAGLVGITVPDDATADVANLHIYNLVANGNVKVSTAGGDWLYDTEGDFTGAGNVTAGYFQGNGAFLTGISALGSFIANGTSTVDIGTVDGNVVVTTDGANAWTFDTAGNLTMPGSLVAETAGNTGSLRWEINGSNLNVLKLIPDDNLVPEDRYVVIDPYNTGHIHIRAGGIQDASNSYLYLGGEDVHVEVDDVTKEIRVKTYDVIGAGSWQFSFKNDGRFQSPNGIITGGNLSVSGNAQAQYFIGNGALLTGISAGSLYSNANAAAYAESGWGGNIIPNANAVYSLGNATNQWGNLWVANNTIYLGNVPLAIGAGNVLTVDGNAVLQNGSNSTISTTGNITANYFIGNGSQLTGLSATYGNANVAAYLPTYTGNLGAGNVNFVNGSTIKTAVNNINMNANTGGAVEITTDGGNYTWSYDNYGWMYLPQAQAAYTPVANGSVLFGSEALVFKAGYANLIFDNTGNTTTANYFLGNIQSTEGNIFGLDSFNFTVENISARIANNGVNIGAGGFNNLLVLPTDVLIQNVPLTVAGNIVANEVNGLYITANAPVGGTARIWNFGTDGNLTVAGNIQTISTGFAFSSGIIGVNNSTPAVITTADNVFSGSETGQVTISGVNPPVQVNGTWYYQAVAINGFALYLDAGLTQPVDASGWPGYVGPGGLAVSPGYSNISITAGNVSLVTGTGNTWQFGDDGRLTFPGTPRIDTNSDNFEVQAAESINLEANAVVNIYTDTSGTAYQWQFGDDGDLNLPANGTIVGVTDDNSGYLQWLGNSSGDGLGYTTLILVPDDTVSSQVLVLDPTAPGHIHLRSPGIGGNIEQPTANIFLGPEDTSFEITAQYADAPEARIHSGGNTWTFDNTGNLTAPGNVIFADNYVYSGNTFKSPNSTVGNLNAFAWQFSDNSIGNDTITLQWNLFDTTTSQWYLSTDSQTNAWTLDSATKKFSYSALNASPGSALTFGNAAANGTGAVNDIELTSSDSNVYIRANSSSWQFDNDGTLSAPGNITTTGNVSAAYLVVSGGIRATGASPAPTLSGFSSISTVGATGNITASGTLIANVGIITTGNITGNTAGYTIGYRDIPQVAFTGNATIAAADAGKHFYSTESTNYVLTIANNSSQVFQVGTAITVVNRGTGTITIAQGSGVSLYLAGNSTAGNRTISTYGMASLLNVAANVWMINGTGVT